MESDIILRRCFVQCIGQTGHDFRVRLGEHKSAVSHGLERSAVCQHVKNRNHPLDWKNAAILYHSNNELNHLVFESAICIHQEELNFQQYPGGCVHRQLVLRHSPEQHPNSTTWCRNDSLIWSPGFGSRRNGLQLYFTYCP